MSAIEIEERFQQYGWIFNVKEPKNKISEVLFDDEESGIKAVEDLGPVFEWDGETVQI